MQMFVRGCVIMCQLMTVRTDGEFVSADKLQYTDKGPTSPCSKHSVLRLTGSHTNANLKKQHFFVPVWVRTFELPLYERTS